MRLSRSSFLYIALACCAIAGGLAFGLRTASSPANAATDYSAYQDMLEGDMQKLRFHSAPKAVGTAPFITESGDMTLAEYRGKYMLLNFWATWCAPCRKEMPMLAALQDEFGGEDFQVVTLATGRNPPPAIKGFFDEIGVTNLPMHRDPKQALARQMGVLGLPITVLITPEGQEIARMQGDAHWTSDSARAMIRALIGAGG
ncbi:TlpA disulfide reductase family protein [Rhodobacteraceae bacterium KMM 6894]|nr:TlpA disulfide reductase family protein [Rhodobacteraceae bacterium KMM 6894]